MDKQIIKFGDTETEKRKFHQQPYFNKQYRY